MAKKGRRSTHEERVRAIQLMANGWRAEDVAEALGVSRGSVFAWQKTFREGGLEALSTKFASGRPTTLSDEQMMQVYTWVVGSDPRAHTFGFALWTRQLVRDLIARHFRVRLSLPTVGRILKKLGLSPQRPLYRAYQQDPEKVRVWKQETFPAIKAEAVAAGAEVFFADEAGIRTDHHGGTTWGRIGRTPVVIATGERKSINMISAVNAKGLLRFQVFEGTLNAGRFIEFCNRLLADASGPVFLIVDGHPAHRAKETTRYVESTNGRLKLFFLPGYSPELNPDEWVWKNVKHDRIKRAVPMSQTDMKRLAIGALRRLQKMPQTVRGFFADPHLAYIRA